MSESSRNLSPNDQFKMDQGKSTPSNDGGPGYLERHKSWDEETWTTWSPTIDQSDDENSLEVSFGDQEGEAILVSESATTSRGGNLASQEFSYDMDQGEASFGFERPATDQGDSDLMSPKVSPGILRSPNRLSEIRGSSSHIIEGARPFPNVHQLNLLCFEAIHSEEAWATVRMWIRDHSDAQVKAALEFRSDPPDRMTALHLACLACPPHDIIEIFLRMAAETASWRDGHGNIALDYARCSEAPSGVVIKLVTEQTRLKREASRKSFMHRDEGPMGGDESVESPASTRKHVAFDKNTSFTSRDSSFRVSTRPIPDRRHSDAAPLSTPLLSEDDIDDLRSSYSENDRYEVPQDLLMFFQASPLVGTLSNWQLQSLERLDFESEREDVKDAVEEVVGSRLAISFEIVTPNLLSQFLTEGAGRVLHFSCHGHKKSLYVEDGWGHAEVLRVENLRNWIRDGGKRLELVFVSACQSRSIGDYFIQAGVPHVVCCQTDSQELQNVAAVEFERAFYRALCRDKTLQEAFDLAIHQVLNSPAIQENIRQDEAQKFALLPEGGDHDVKIFFMKPMKPTSFLRKRAPQNAAFPRCPSRIVGRQIQMYQIIRGLQGSPMRLVRVSGDPGVGTDTVVQASLEYIAERRSINKFGEIIWLPRRDGSEVSNDFAKLYDECLRDERYQLSAGGPTSKGESHALKIVEHFRHRKIKSLLVLDGKEILSNKGIQLLSYFIQTLLRESRHVKLIVLHRPGVKITHPKMSCVPEDVLVPPLDLKETAELFALSCPHVRNRVCCGVGTVRDFVDVIVGGEGDCSNGHMSKRRALYYEQLGRGNAKLVRQVAFGMSEEEFKKLVDKARCPRAPLPSVKSRVELDRKLQDMNEELARAIESENFSLAQEIHENFDELALLRQRYLTLLELEAMADVLERKKDYAIEGTDYLAAGYLQRELQQLEIKIRTERIAKEADRPALLRSPPSFRNLVANVSSVRVDGDTLSMEHSEERTDVVTENIFPCESETDSRDSNVSDDLEGVADDTISADTGLSGSYLQPRPTLTLGWVTAADSGVPHDCLEGLGSRPVIQLDSFQPMQGATPKLLPSSSSQPSNAAHSELARQQGPSGEKAAEHPSDQDRKQSPRNSDEKLTGEGSSRVSPGATGEPPGDTKEAKRTDMSVEEKVDDGISKTVDHVQDQDVQESQPGAVPVCGINGRSGDSGDQHWFGEIFENSEFWVSTSDSSSSADEQLPRAYRTAWPAGERLPGAIHVPGIDGHGPTASSQSPGDMASDSLAVAEPIEAESEQDRVVRLVDEAVNNRFGTMSGSVPRAEVVRPRRRRFWKLLGKLFHRRH
jgi:hypothetical protein